MKTTSFMADEHELPGLPDGLYWITDVAVFLDDTRVDAGGHRYWKGVLETNNLTKSDLIFRLRDKRSIFSDRTCVRVRGYCHRGVS